MTYHSLTSKYPHCEKFRFGDSKKLCEQLTALVREGTKTATCGALRDFQNDKEKMPAPGRIDIVLNWDGTPAVAIKTLSVEIKRFCDVDEKFAIAEGENNNLKDWQLGHKAYFERNGGFDSQMKVVCEYFEVVEDFEAH